MDAGVGEPALEPGLGRAPLRGVDLRREPALGGADPFERVDRAVERVGLAELELHAGEDAQSEGGGASAGALTDRHELVADREARPDVGRALERDRQRRQRVGEGDRVVAARAPWSRPRPPARDRRARGAGTRRT